MIDCVFVYLKSTRFDSCRDSLHDSCSSGVWLELEPCEYQSANMEGAFVVRNCHLD